MIGSLYDTRGVIVGQAAGFVAPENTPLPGDSITVFDESVWLSDAFTVGAATAGTVQFTVSGIPTKPGTFTTASVAYNATATAVAAAIQAVLPAGYTAFCTLTGGLYTFWVSGPGAYKIVIVPAVGTALTGGALANTLNPWSATGGTEQGWTTSWQPNATNIQIEEQATPVDQQMSSAAFQFSANLAEDTINNWQFATGGSLATQTPTTSLFGKTTLSMASVFTRFAIALETKNSVSMPRRFYAPSAIAVAQVSQAFRRADGARMIPVQFTTVCDITQCQIIEITANHS
jgi:hypothetical protein